MWKAKSDSDQLAKIIYDMQKINQAMININLCYNFFFSFHLPPSHFSHFIAWGSERKILLDFHKAAEQLVS